ncbi:MAG TPA: DUF1501 domain-containing protein [Kofleriaceae bacterium]|nr:DUF1501 domain-containing protein [Kofleriaceae bacterium]
MSKDFSRRGLFRRAAIAAGAFSVGRIPGLSWLEREARADAAGETPAVFIFNMIGGYNALFGSADSFQGTGDFGVTATNIKQVGTTRLFVDKSTLGTLSANTLNHMASIGVDHGITSHPTARMSLLFDGNNKSRLISLSNALGGTAAVRCVNIGNLMSVGTHTAQGGVSLQQVRDLSTTIAVLGGVTSANAPARALASDGIAASQAMSADAIAKNPTSARSFAESYPAASAQLKETTVPFEYATMASAYGLTAGTNGSYATDVRNTTMQIMGAELMIRAGANVVIANQGGWDTHGDNNGSEVRNKIIGDGTIAALKVFTDRMMAETGKNVVTAIVGDFSRSLPGSNHQANLTATVIGKYVKAGTTGRVTADVALPGGTPGIQGLWAYIAAALKCPTQPFGANPHGLVL